MSPKDDFIKIDADLELMPSGVVKFDKRKKAHPVVVSIEEYEKYLDNLKKNEKNIIKDNIIGDIND